LVEFEKFELQRLANRDEASLIAEIRRVASLTSEEVLTTKKFDELSRVHSSTLRRRYGGWRQTLERAGIGERFDGSNLKIDRTRLEIISEIQKIAGELGSTSLKKDQFISRSGSYTAVIRAFGSWGAALKSAGISQTPLGKRYSDEECFENLFNVWRHYGRQPYHDELKVPPSIVGPKTYTRRWGTWLKALEAFVARVNHLDEDNSPTDESTGVRVPSLAVIEMAPDKSESAESLNQQTNQAEKTRDVPLSVRYSVLIRDRCRCKICGRNPATDLAVELHIDHIIPWSKGGANKSENLRVLCKDCNLGKGDRLERKL